MFFPIIPYNLVRASSKAVSHHKYTDGTHSGRSGSFAPSPSVTGKVLALNAAKAVYNSGKVIDKLVGGKISSLPQAKAAVQCVRLPAPLGRSSLDTRFCAVR